MPIGFHDRVYTILRRISRLEDQPALFLGTQGNETYCAFIATPETLEILYSGNGKTIDEAVDNLFTVILSAGEFHLTDLKLLNKSVCLFWVGKERTDALIPILRKFTSKNFIRVARDEAFTAVEFKEKDALFALIEKASKKGAEKFYSRF